MDYWKLKLSSIPTEFQLWMELSLAIADLFNALFSLFQRSSINRSAIITREDSLDLCESNPAMKSIPAKLIHSDLILCFDVWPFESLVFDGKRHF